MNPKYLDVLACPGCKGQLNYDEKHQHLVCALEKLAYPIVDGIMMLERGHAINLTVSSSDATAAL
jgi:uncharacterized protein